MCDDLSEILDDHSFLSIMGYITGDEYEGTGSQQHPASLSELASMAQAQKISSPAMSSGTSLGS